MIQTRRELAELLERGASFGLHPNNVASEDAALPLLHTSNPKEIYLNTSRDKVALRCPYPLLPSMALSPGHAFASQHPDGTPVLVYRDKTNPTHLSAFVNVCRHRGSPLLQINKPNMFKTTPCKAPLLTCPYHSWTYDANTGDLRKIPGHEQAFCRIQDKTPFQLKQLACQEGAGMVWIGGEDELRTNGQWGIDEINAALRPLLFDYDSQENGDNSLHPNRIIGYREWDLDANWQLLVETVLESYHVKHLHKRTLGQVTHPTWAMVSSYMDNGFNLRHSVPLVNFDTESAAIAKEEEWTHSDTRDFLGQTSTGFVIFPLTSINLFKRFATFTTFAPTHTNNGSNKKDTTTQSKVRMWALPHRYFNASSEDEQQQQERDLQSMIAGVEEDWDCAVNTQAGLSRETKTSDFIYGGYEGNNVRFLENIKRIANVLHEHNE